MCKYKIIGLVTKSRRDILDWSVKTIGVSNCHNVIFGEEKLLKPVTHDSGKEVWHMSNVQSIGHNFHYRCPIEVILEPVETWLNEDDLICFNIFQILPSSFSKWA
jgi:hypothetical protein